MCSSKPAAQRRPSSHEGEKNEGKLCEFSMEQKGADLDVRHCSAGESYYKCIVSMCRSLKTGYMNVAHYRYVPRHFLPIGPISSLLMRRLGITH